mgnify:CR=1 FL=1
MKYTDVKTPEMLLEFMEQIEYGFYDKQDKKFYSGNDMDFENALSNKWVLSSAEQTIKTKVGICYDQVELERDFFSKNKFEFVTLFVWFACKKQNKYPTHTFLVYKDKTTNDWCWFEHSDFANKGIHHFVSFKKALQCQKQTHIKYAKHIRKTKTDISKIQTIQYSTPPKNCKMLEFLNFIFDTGKPIEF